MGVTVVPAPSWPSPDRAFELLDVTSEAELDEFLRELIDEGVSRTGARLPVHEVRALLTVLRRTAEQTLPTLAPLPRAVGTGARSPGGGPLVTAARVYGMELEGLSAEDRDYEIARQFTRFANAAIGHAVNRLSAVPTTGAARAAVHAAAQEFAPGLLALGLPLATGPTSGPWVRRGKAIVLIGVEPSGSSSAASAPAQDQ